MKLKMPGSVPVFNVCLAALFLYSLVPMLIPPATMEGFEAYVTNGINHNIHPLFSSITFPYYNISNRLGEFVCYTAVCKAFGVDARSAAWAANAVSYVSYLLLASLAITRKFGVAFPAVLFGLLLFPDTSAVASQTSSCLLALPWVAACFLAISHRFPLNTVVAAAMLAIASVFRIDTLGIMPFILAWYFIDNEEGIATQVKKLAPFVVVPFAVWGIYKLKGYNIIAEIKSASAPLPANWRVMLIMVSCFFSIPAILLSCYGFLGRMAAVARKQTSQLHRAVEALALAALCFGPLLLWMYLYRTKPDTPRFLIVTSFFLAVPVSMGVSNLLALRSRITRSVSVCALAFVIVLSLCFWNSRTMALSDGSRLQYLNMGLPYYFYNQKATLSNQFQNLDNVLFGAKTATSGRSIFVITSWRVFNEVNRLLIDKDFRLVDADPHVLSIIKKFPRPLGNFTFKNRNGKEIVVILSEARRDFDPGDPSTLYDVIATLRGTGKIVLLSVHNNLNLAASRYGARELVSIRANDTYLPIHNDIHVILCD
ncbi:hypothetical protein [Geomonas anaerohicana]|uniref:Glycosyltransferase RgtA/B/C/D-like domain-containing protein n=1 Tax=Geomonas anaerohicana TaxID=2798583 RepID=A0ABS0YGQ5_9BACT|nr:hypothetical protein [Geomonas anaerohicana]MBJ6751471.1 hypothetical protein [Geomonas anaerohicana]